jgi:hypothetical protein
MLILEVTKTNKSLTYIITREENDHDCGEII